VGKSESRTVSFWVPFVLAACTAVSILSTDLFTPSIPSLPEIFGTDIGTVQYTVSVNLFAYAIAQLFHGPVSDAFGRRRLLLVSFSLFVCFSVLCALAMSIEALLLGRFMQGLASSVPSVVVVLLIRELYPPKKAVSVMGLYGAALGIAPAIGPLIGAYLHTWFGWSGSFWTIAALAAVVTVLFYFLVPETLTEKHPLQARAALSNYGTLLLRKDYLRCLIPLSLIFGAFYAYVTTGPVVMIDLFGLSEQAYGQSYVLIIVAFVLGNLMAGRLTKVLESAQIVSLAAVIALIAGLGMAVPAAFGDESPAIIVVTMCIFAIGLGAIMAAGPIVLLNTVSDLPQGPASALLGSSQLGAAALASFLSGSFYNHSALSLSATVAGFAFLSCIPLFTVKPQRAST
jgi:MFS transporter, DHA1 family, multidrug resistance protein